MLFVPGGIYVPTLPQLSFRAFPELHIYHHVYPGLFR